MSFSRLRERVASLKHWKETRCDERLGKLTEVLLEKCSYVVDISVFWDGGITSIESDLLRECGEREREREREERERARQRYHH